MGKLKLQTPAMIRFGEETEDEVFITLRSGQRGHRGREHGERTAGLVCGISARMCMPRCPTWAITRNPS